MSVYTNAVSVLQGANDHLGHAQYSWEAVTLDAGAVRTECGMKLHLPPLDAGPMGQSDTLVVIGSLSNPWIATDGHASLRCAPTRYYTNLRLDRAHRLLAQPSMTVVEVALACGFETHSTFAKRFRQRFGISPTDLRKQENFSVSPNCRTI